VDGRVREQPFGHLLGPLRGRIRRVGVHVDLEAVGRAEGLEFEPEPLERPRRRLGLRVEHPVFQPDGDGGGVAGHYA
jgi:hypothetical protein